MLARPWSLSLLGLLAQISIAQAGVVINEIFYHAPNEINDLEYLELYNTGAGSVDLTGWKLARAIDFQFSPGTQIAADGYLVLARDADRFKEYYGVAPAGTFKGTLSHKGTRIDLLDRRGKKVDSVHYKDEAPWPTGADGYSASLERICPTADGTRPENWSASPLPPDEMKPAGTPGQRNTSYATSVPPAISDVKFSPVNPMPDQAIRVEATVSGPEVREVKLRYRLASAGTEQPEISLPMSKETDRHFSAVIPPQKANQLIRFRIEATNQKEARRVFPGENEPRPAFSCLVHEKYETGKIPLAFVINVDPEESKAIEKHMRSPNQRGGFNEAEQIRMMARMQLESSMDLAPLWFSLSTAPNAAPEQLKRLRGALTDQLSARDKLINQTLESSDLKEKMPTLPTLAKAFNAQMSEALQPVLTADQKKQLEDLQKKQAASAGGGRSNFTPDMLLKRLLNLEGTFFKLSTRQDVTEEQFKPISEAYRAALKQRSDLAPAVQALMQGQGDFEDLRDKVEKVNEQLGRTLKPLLKPPQARDWERWRKESESFMPGQGRTKPTHRPQGRAAFVYVDPQSHEPELFDFVNVTERNSGLNVHFHKDRLFHAMSTVNVLFETNDRFVLAEPLAYEVYRRAGNAAPMAEYMRLTVDGHPLGYYEFIEQPNRAFLQRNHLKGDGNLYKILWYERGVVGQHEKKTNRNTGHDDIVELVDALEKTKDNSDAQWEVIKKNFNIEQVVNYFAVNMCLSDWDGFFNNYFTYHDSSGSGRWEMYPWDQDKTWGFYDGMPDNEVFYDLPLTFGMEGDRPPGFPKDRPAPRGIGVGKPWWRTGGYFSKPLLANPHFRKLFLARTKELLGTVYNEETFFPLIDAVGNRLEEEVRIRAIAIQEDPGLAVARLHDNLKSLKEHLSKRRIFLLEQDEIRSAGKYSRAEVDR